MKQNLYKKPAAARSALGEDIPLYASADPASLKDPILLIGGVHGDEPEGVELATRTLELLGAEQSPRPWILIPCLNPDGYQRGTRVNGNGVDLNRNYPSRSWAPSFENERYHPGPSSGSEPETRLIVDLIHSCRPRVLIHCHSWDPMVIYAGEPGLSFAEPLAKASGYELKSESAYSSSGSLSQYGWHDHGIPVICIEERAGCTLAEIWPRFRAGMREIFGITTV